MTAHRQTASGTFTLALPPHEAFRLFTPIGERDWAPGWDPRFTAATTDDSAPGTVFVTDAHRQTAIWVVVDREQGRSIRYARVLPGSTAGTVTVVLQDDAGHSAVTVTYDLTALTDDAAHDLHHFIEGFPAFLESWRQAIGRASGHQVVGGAQHRVGDQRRGV
ncbi:SRPBCC family protein [Asanoa sp. NPDC049573]|uniref:SRPBCC family protein n=1 Tax=Asanoa sp. NPDC049573 TaxID=3155396 RepID=UPI003417FC4C